MGCAVRVNHTGVQEMTNKIHRVPFIRSMPRRDSGEPHRASTPLELLFDLVSVIAIASAAAGLHHAIADGHVVEGVVKFACAFFGIWWAWMNYTWFASAYDNDDTPFRMLTMLIMAGSLTMATGIGALFESLDLTLIVTGYVIMRLGMVLLWLRAAAGDVDGRDIAITYAVGIAMAQLYWLVFLYSLPLATGWFYKIFAIGVVVEVAVPVIAEKKGRTPWHRHHIVERYGLLTLIVLGETLTAASLAIEDATSQDFDMHLLRIAVSAMLILFSMWWLYFSREEQLETNDRFRAFIWGYGHLLIFASGAAVGAGIAVAVEVAMHSAHVVPVVANYAIAIPVAIYMAGLWFVRDRFAFKQSGRFVLPMFAGITLLVAMLPVGVETIAATIVVCTIVRARFAAAEIKHNIPATA